MHILVTSVLLVLCGLMSSKVDQYGQSVERIGEQSQDWTANLNHGQRQRLRYLESRLLWEGEVNRRHVCQEFGVTPNHFTREMRAYKDHFPGNVWYDETSRSYRPTNSFQPGIASGDPTEYLLLLRAYAQYPVNSLRTEMGGGVPCDALKPPECIVDKDILRSLLQAIHRKRGSVIQYQSFSHGNPESRTIWPHAMMWTGESWHVRAFDDMRNENINLALTRFSSVEFANVTRPAAAEVDIDWEELETVEIVPNPGLSEGQQNVLAREYGMELSEKGWMWRVTLRRCLVPYFLYRYRLDEDRSDLTRDGFPLQRLILVDSEIRRQFAFGKD